MVNSGNSEGVKFMFIIIAKVSFMLRKRKGGKRPEKINETDS